MNKPYHERPDWILKAIGYYCDNYILDGQDLRKFKRGAIEHYKRNDQTDLGNAFAWCFSPQGDMFWLHLWRLTTGRETSNCSPWTNYEKRKIAKLPEVK